MNIHFYIVTQRNDSIASINDGPKKTSSAHLRLNFMVVFNWHGNLIFYAIEWAMQRAGERR